MLQAISIVMLAEKKVLLLTNGTMMKEGKIWSAVAIDYEAGTDPYDPITKTMYSEEEAHKLPDDIKSRLVNKPRKVGCYVNK